MRALLLLALAACRSPPSTEPAPGPAGGGAATVTATATTPPITTTTTAVPEACDVRPTEAFPPGSSPSATRIVLDDVVARKPRRGLFVTEGWAQSATHCNPCPPGATCKPCEEVVWLSPSFGDFKDPLERDQNLVLSVPDARSFDQRKHYRVLFAACDAHSTRPDAPLRADLRGLELLP